MYKIHLFLPYLQTCTIQPTGLFLLRCECGWLIIPFDLPRSHCIVFTAADNLNLPSKPNDQSTGPSKYFPETLEVTNF